LGKVVAVVDQLLRRTIAVTGAVGLWPACLAMALAASIAAAILPRYAQRHLGG